MPELLIELFSEEIPARMQRQAIIDLQTLLTDKLAAHGLSASTVKAYATPRRLVCVAQDVPERQQDIHEERRGPRVGAPQAALTGFLKANDASLAECVTRTTDKGNFYFLPIHKPGANAQDILPALLVDVILAMPWPKSMRMASQSLRWIRPLQRLLALFDGRPLSGALDLGRSVAPPQPPGFMAKIPPDAEALALYPRYLPFGDLTVGHPFLAPEPFPVTDFADYQANLRAAKVILDEQERQNLILQAARRLAAEEGYRLIEDNALLEEVTGLVEWPLPLVGHIEERFMHLPREVLITSMRSHQKYFAFEREDGSLAPRFLVIANMLAPDGGALIQAGNERVLRARLADAEFFWQQDCKSRLEDNLASLHAITFHARLGNLRARIDRMVTLAGHFADRLPGAMRPMAERAALLAKCDLNSAMVGEFPELQGIMGRYYALNQGEEPVVADAIAGHYAPKGPQEACPTAPVTIAVALSEKLDTLVGFFAIGERPSGSADPYALRRAGLGLIRLILENHLRLSLSEDIIRAYQLYGFANSPPHKLTPIAALEDVRQALLQFLADRLKVYWRERGIAHDVISAAFAVAEEDDLTRLMARVNALQEFLASTAGENLLAAFRRATNIVRIEMKKRAGTALPPLDPALFVAREEYALYEMLSMLEQPILRAIEQEAYQQAMALLAQLREPIDAFFAEVTVNVQDTRLQSNRLALLERLGEAFAPIADFSRLEG
jgi:glycyl-tRNA synthetase beta chain